MNEAHLLEGYLFVGAVLFSLGLVGFLTRRNMIVMFLCAEMMLQGVSLNLVAWGRYHNDWGGQALTVFILTVAACEAALALALVTMLYRARGSLDIVVWQDVREANQAPYIDQELPEEAAEPEHEWPELAPSGLEPVLSEVDSVYRSHV